MIVQGSTNVRSKIEEGTCAAAEEVFVDSVAHGEEHCLYATRGRCGIEVRNYHYRCPAKATRGICCTLLDSSQHAECPLQTSVTLGRQMCHPRVIDVSP